MLRDMGMATTPGREGRQARLWGRQELAGPRAEGELPQVGWQAQRQEGGNPGHTLALSVCREVRALGRVLGAWERSVGG